MQPTIACYEHYLIASIDQCAQRIVELVADPRRGKAFGDAARDHVRTRYTLPRMLRDELRLVRSLVMTRAQA